MFLFFVLYHFMLSGNFCYGLEIRHAIFWGIYFSPRIFLGFDFCRSFDHYHLKSGEPPLGLS